MAANQEAQKSSKYFYTAAKYCLSCCDGFDAICCQRLETQLDGAWAGSSGQLLTVLLVAPKKYKTGSYPSGDGPRSEFML